MSTFIVYTYQPSSIVIIDNRKDCQSIVIQDRMSSFSSTNQIAGSTGTNSKVVVDVSDNLFEPAEGKLFDDRFERIAQIMNRFK